MVIDYEAYIFCNKSKTIITKNKCTIFQLFEISRGHYTYLFNDVMIGLLYI